VYTGFWWGNLRAIDHLEEAGVDWKIILRWVFRKWDVGHGLTVKFFAHCHSHPKTLVQQIGNYTLAEFTNMYMKCKT
jgi:hypothetical protein